MRKNSEKIWLCISRSLFLLYPTYFTFLYYPVLYYPHLCFQTTAYHFGLIRIIADVEKCESDRNRNVHFILLLSLRFPHPLADRGGKLLRGHSDIFFPPTWDSGVLNHPDFSRQDILLCPRKRLESGTEKKNEKRARAGEREKKTTSKNAAGF